MNQIHRSEKIQAVRKRLSDLEEELSILEAGLSKRGGIIPREKIEDLRKEMSDLEEMLSHMAATTSARSQ